MKKKILALLLVCLSVFNLFACGSQYKTTLSKSLQQKVDKIYDYVMDNLKDTPMVSMSFEEIKKLQGEDKQAFINNISSLASTSENMKNLDFSKFNNKRELFYGIFEVGLEDFKKTLIEEGYTIEKIKEEVDLSKQWGFFKNTNLDEAKTLEEALEMFYEGSIESSIELMNSLSSLGNLDPSVK